MTYRLHNRPGSGGFVVEAALVLAEAPLELADIAAKPNTPLPDSFRAINPWGQVPALELPDGTMMTETVAILIHLGACFPEKGLAPPPGTSEHARFLRWLVFAGTNVYEAVLRRIYTARFTADPAAENATRTAAQRRINDALAVLDSAVAPGPYLLGETMSLADVYFAMLYIWSRVQVPVPHLMALADGVRTHPTIAPVWRRHFADRARPAAAETYA